LSHISQIVVKTALTGVLPDSDLIQTVPDSCIVIHFFQQPELVFDPISAVQRCVKIV